MNLSRINIFYLLIFITVFTGLFLTVEIVQEKSTRKRLLKSEVRAIGEFVKFSCLSETIYNSDCIDKIVDKYLSERKQIFESLPSYLNNVEIFKITKSLPEDVGVDDKNFFKKKYSLKFHKYYKFLGLNMFLENYTTTTMIHDYKDNSYSFIFGSINQLELIKQILIKALYYLCGLIFIIIIYILFMKDRIDCPFFYEKRDRITTKYFIFLIIACFVFIIFKKFSAPYDIKNVYPWILSKMNPYKIHEFIFYMICSLGFLFFYVFKDYLKIKISYRKMINEKLKNIRKL